MCHHYLLLFQQWPYFICHDGRVLHLLAKHCTDAQGYVTISFLAKNTTVIGPTTILGPRGNSKSRELRMLYHAVGKYNL